MSGTDERSDPGVGRTALHAKQISLLCWLLVLTLAVSAECAWVLWLQDVWTVESTEARPPRPSSPSEQIARGAANPER
jgi:hypothetical protein